MTEPVIRPLTVDDLDAALKLSTAAGWNQQAGDWRILLQLAATGAFAAVSDTRVVGTAIGIDYGGFAWIAMMLVDPAFRGRGVGGRLLEAAVGAVPPNHPIRLDATPLGRPLYERYGFEVEATLSRHVSRGSNREVPPVGDDSRNSPEVRPLAASDLKMVTESDRETFGGTRAAVLEWAFHRAPQYAYAVRSGDSLIHYCLGRHGRVFDQMGPIVAGDEATAGALVNAALDAAGDRPVAVDAFDSQIAFSETLRRHGFLIERPLIRMRRAAESAAPDHGVRALPAAAGACQGSRRRGTEFAILGPEFG
jgi:GNAT superfamily N-acetyltransferase